MEKQLFILNGFALNSYGLADLGDRAVYQITLDKVKLHFPNILVLLKEEQELVGLEKEQVLVVPQADVYNSFSQILKKFANYENYLFADLSSPFLDATLGSEMVDRNNEESGHYTYGEHYPKGIAPEVLSLDCLKILHNLASGNNKPLDDEAIFDLMGFDINSYDIEIIVSAEDFRRYRLDFRSIKLENRRLIEQFAKQFNGEISSLSYAELTRLILDKPAIVRTVPGYVEIDLSENCNLSCSYCPREVMSIKGQTNSDFMELDKLLKIGDQLQELSPNAVVSFSPFSEPLLHPKIKEIVSSFVERGFKVIIETNGSLLTTELVQFFAGFDFESLVVIVSLDHLNQAEYLEYKGSDYFEQVIGSIKELLTLKPRNSFIQVLNMEGLSDKLDKFYEFWHDFRDNILPIKYNNFAGKLPSKSGADLSPLTRHSCWHLQRDMQIRLDGTVGHCKQDLFLEKIAGNVFSDGLEKVWNKLGEFYNEHVLDAEKEFTPCKECDEWYTYNF